MKLEMKEIKEDEEFYFISKRGKKYICSISGFLMKLTAKRHIEE